MKKSTAKRIIPLFLSLVLTVCCFVACGDNNSGNKATIPNTDNQNNDAVLNNSENQDSNTQNTSPWVLDAFKNGEYISAYPFFEDLAYIRIDDRSYFIDREGNLEIALSTNPMFNADTAEDEQAQARFYNDLFFMTDHLINTKGESITAEDLGGTALHTTNIDYELLEGGYIVVDKVALNFAQTTYESAIYNTELEQIQPYSSTLYTLFHPDITTGYKLQYYNGCVYYNNYEVWKTYAIATNTFAEYDVLPSDFDRLCYNAGVGEITGLYKGDDLILDLSEQKTLQNVECVGDQGLATFRNEEGQGYFTIIDTNGNFKFEPILFSSMQNYGDSCQFNGNVILVKTFLGQQEDGTQAYQFKTFDITGTELGCLSETTTGANQLRIHFGEDTIVIRNNSKGSVCYYNTSLTPLFPAK